MITPIHISKIKVPHFWQAFVYFCRGRSLVAQVVKNPPAVQEISGSGRSPRKGNGYPLQYSYLANSMDRGAWKATVLGSQSDMTELLNTYRFFSIHLLLVNLIFPLTYINNRGLLDWDVLEPSLENCVTFYLQYEFTWYSIVILTYKCIEKYS